MSTAAPATRTGLFARIFLFIRQVVAELKKVVWPTRPQLINYTIVVLIFVVLMAGIVAVLDYGFTKLMLLIFG